MGPVVDEATGRSTPLKPSQSRRIRDVWAWNFDAEFDNLLAAVGRGGDAIVAFDIEFPGCVCEDPPFAVHAVRYPALQENVDLLQPIQIGLAVTHGDGELLQGAWNFNVWFDLTQSLYTEESVRFLAAAGIDFSRHAREGIDPLAISWRLASSALVGKHSGSPRWVTFSGWHDWGYLLKVLTYGRPMPPDLSSFQDELSALCPHRHELRDRLPRGSLDSLIAKHGIQRVGVAHTAGSDALATLELYLQEHLPEETTLEGGRPRPRDAGNRVQSWPHRWPTDGKGLQHARPHASSLSARAPPFVGQPALPPPGGRAAWSLAAKPGPATAAAVFVPGGLCWNSRLGSVMEQGAGKDRAKAELAIERLKVSSGSSEEGSSATLTPLPAPSEDLSDATTREMESDFTNSADTAQPAQLASRPYLFTAVVAYWRHFYSMLAECKEMVRSLELNLLLFGSMQLVALVFSCCHLLL